MTVQLFTVDLSTPGSGVEIKRQRIGGAVFYGEEEIRRQIEKGWIPTRLILVNTGSQILACQEMDPPPKT